MSERSERTMNAGFGEAPGAEPLTAAPAMRGGRGAQLNSEEQQ